MAIFERLSGAVCVAICLATAVPAVATETPKPDVSALVDAAAMQDIRDMLASEILTLSVLAQNEHRGSLKQADIDALDKQWRAEREQADKPLIATTMASPLSSYLIRRQAASLGLYSEIFVMDANGLNVGQSAITSDYWQGDEAKFQKTFQVAPDAVFIDEAEWHEGSRTWRVQVNLALIGDEPGKAIGAATVEINLTELARRRAD